MINSFLNGNYQLDVQRRTTIRTGGEIDICKPMDTLVLKVVTKIVEKRIFNKISNRCFHVKGRGGLKGAIRDAIANKEKYPFVFKTDVKSYYDSIDHGKLLSMLSIYRRLPPSFPDVFTSRRPDIFWLYVSLSH